MGKGIFFFIAAAVVGGSMMMLQSQQTAVKTDARQSEQQEKVLAREIARSAYNTASTLAREMETNGEKLEEIGEALGTEDNPVTGEYQGGTYESWATLIRGATYRVGARGFFGGSVYTINGSRLIGGTLKADGSICPTDCVLKARFLESQAGYCSAVYLERTLPDTDEEDQPEPEMLFPPGKSSGAGERDTSTVYTTRIAPGTQMNFLLAVDQNCSHHGDTNVKHDDPTFNHVRPALVEDTKDLDKLNEGLWAMTELKPNVDNEEDWKQNIWRVAFEDRPGEYDGSTGKVRFTREKLLDIKTNGYPVYSDGTINLSANDNTWNGETYGGTGVDDWPRWTYGPQKGYLDMEDYGDIPDFSDQVFEVELIDYEDAVDQGLVADDDDE